MGNTDLVVGVKVEVVDENSGSIKIEIEGYVLSKHPVC